MVASNYVQNMNVLYCNSGCDGNVVQVRFHHKNFTGQSTDYGKPLTDMIAKYDELYGKDAYEQDSQKVDESLEPNGRMISCLLYTSPSPRDRTRSRMPSSA